MKPNQNKSQIIFLQYGLWICIFAFWFAVSLYTRLGVYSRYMSDDYCETSRVMSSSNPLSAVTERYISDFWPRASMRYSNLFFVGVSEMLGENAMQITIPSLILLWVVGLTLSMRELRKFLDLALPIQVDLFAGGFLAFFTILLSPNPFQTFYWRSAAMTHFAPLVFASFLAALLLRSARTLQKHSPVLYGVVFFTTFVIAGFSEPPATVMVTVFGLIIVAAYLWDRSSNKAQKLALVTSALLGAVAGIIAMLASPAITPVDGAEKTGIVTVLLNSFIYSFQFLLDAVKSSPLPFGIIFTLALLAAWLYSEPKDVNKKSLVIQLMVLPFLLWVLIASSFAPSVFGQGYPVERARLLGIVLSVGATAILGVLLGRLASAWKALSWSDTLQWTALVLFFLIGTVYPLRRALVLYSETIPEYSLRAEYWDAREMMIKDQAASGEMDIVIPGFEGIYGVKELDSRPDFWFNRCAADIYGVNSIRTISYDPADLEKLLGE